MLNIQRALRPRQLMRALTGMTVTEFENLVITFKAVLAKHQTMAKSKRQRAIGGGRKHTLKTTPERLFFILFYLKCYPTMLAVAFIAHRYQRPELAGSRTRVLAAKTLS